MSTFRLLLAGMCIGLTSTAALGQQASSSAYGVGANANVTAANVVTATVNIGPLSQASGSAPPTYNSSNSLASVSQSAALTTGPLGVTEGLQTGILTSSASGSATGAQSSAIVNNLQLTASQATFLATLLGLGATTIQSTSQASSSGGLSASGSTTIEGLTLTGSLLGGLTFDGSLYVNPDPNTVLLSIAGLTITLNEQSTLGDGLTSLGISTNAIDVAFNNFALGTNLVNGNIIVGHSEALASLGHVPPSVPEPATWATMLLGFAAMGIAIRRRKAGRMLQFA